MNTTREISSGGIVLLYHRVARVATDPQLLVVTPEHFAEHLEVLGQIATPMALREMRSAAERGTLPHHATAITFDDGYADNFRYAEPLLRRYGFPTTVFATTGHTDTLSEFFWDELDRLLLQPHPLPDELILHCGEHVTRFDTADHASFSIDQWARVRGWNVLEPAQPGSRQQLYLDLCRILHPMTSRQRIGCLRQLRDWAGLGSIGRETNRMMTSIELRQLSRSGNVEIGAHSVTHPLLAAETVEQQRAEIRQSREFLEGILDRPVTCFSYPFGTRRDYTASTTAAVEAEGFELACSNFTGKAHAKTDRFQLPRMTVRDWDGIEFARRLQGWFAMQAFSPGAAGVIRMDGPHG